MSCPRVRVIGGGTQTGHHGETHRRPAPGVCRPARRLAHGGRPYAATMGIALNDETRRLLDGRHFAVLATRNPDGGPQTSAMWVGRDGDDVLFSTVAGRRKHRNLERDPRASVSIIDADDPENYGELRGRVTISEDVGRAFDTGLAWKYDGRDPDPDKPGAVRLILRMTVDKATGYAA